MILRRGFRFRLYPTAEQVARLESWEHALRFLWNVANEQREHASRRVEYDRRAPTFYGQCAELTDLRAELPWLAEVPRNVCSQVLAALDMAWQSFFKGLAGRPRFKRKGRDRAPMIESHPTRFSVEGEGRAGAVHFPKVGAIRAVVHRPTKGTPKTCALVRDGDAWFACVTCEFEAPDAPPSVKPPVGIDRGVAVLFADSTRRVVENRRHGEKLRARIARAQRVVARRKKGSQNQQRARERVAKLQRKARRRREHTLHVESHHYAKNHGAVIVEKLNVQGMTKSARGTVESPGVNVAQKSGLNRAILDSGWSRFVSMLRYKAVPEGGRVVEVRAAYSSQTCARCGHVAAESRRERDVFLCLACGHFDNADINAAQVILSRGLSATAVEATGEGCGGDANGRPTRHQLRVAKRGPRPAVGASTEAPMVAQG